MKDEEYYSALLKELFPHEVEGVLYSAVKTNIGASRFTLHPANSSHDKWLMMRRMEVGYEKSYGYYKNDKDAIAVHDMTIRDMGIEIGERKP